MSRRRRTASRPLVYSPSAEIERDTQIGLKLWRIAAVLDYLAKRQRRYVGYGRQLALPF